MEGGGGSCDNNQLLLLMSEDLLIQILLWLPVISLLRFKSVNKSWRSIIESPFFIHLHHATTLPTSSSSSFKLGSCNILLFRRSGIYREEDQMANVCTVSGDEFIVFENFGIPPLQEEDQEESRRSSYRRPFRYDEMVGCCDGIICLHDSMSRNITLWNPATKQYRFLPKPSLNHTFGNPNCRVQNDYYAQDFVRFGIDVKTKDQKLLRITTLKPCPAGGAYERRSVHVYSSSTDSWRRIDDATLTVVHPDIDIDIEMNMNDRGYLNGRCFFTAQYRLNKENKEYFMSLILSFDFTKEIFRTIQPPYERESARFDDNLFFIPFGEKLALADAKREKNLVESYNNYDDFWNYTYDIWVLNEQQHGGVEEEEYSWTKFYTFGPYGDRNPPRCITNNGEFAVIYGWYWISIPMVQVLNLMTGKTKHLQCGSKCITDIGAYKPSLVPIIGGSGAADHSRFDVNQSIKHKPTQVHGASKCVFL